MANQHLRLLFCLLLVTLISSKVHAQLGGKPYQQWTADESTELIVDSPWAQTQAGLVGVGRFDPPTAAVNTAVTISLRSALPVRQALARLRQIKTRYDQKSDRDKAAIDAKNKALLECSECADYYIVAMSPGPGSTNGLSTTVLPLNTVSLAWLKLHIETRNEKGETRELVKVVGPKFSGDEAVFYFTRLNSKGEPLISPANRTLIISFDAQVFGWRTLRVTHFKFDVAKMIVNGQVVF